MPVRNTAESGAIVLPIDILHNGGFIGSVEPFFGFFAKKRLNWNVEVLNGSPSTMLITYKHTT
ncbi:MAG: hypothetical protein AAB447_02240 [Patescibacteria group bacterium]